MKRYILILLTFSVLSCTKHIVIPDDTLADIFCETMVANAYTSTYGIQLDSIQIYEPIFARYGYTTEDVRYTIGNFSRRKSAQLGTVLEQAQQQLDQIARDYQKRVVILDTVRNYSLRAAKRVIYTDSLLKMRSKADSTKMIITLNDIKAGEYDVIVDYSLDEPLDKFPRTIHIDFERADSSRYGLIVARMFSSDVLKRTVKADSTAKKLKLHIAFADKGKVNPKPKVDVKSVTITYTPTKEIAVESLFEKYIPKRIFDDGYFPQIDSLPLSTDK